MLKKQLFASDYFFNARAKIKKDVDKQLIKKDFDIILKNSFNLINNVISNKKIFKFVENKLV